MKFLFFKDYARNCAGDRLEPGRDTHGGREGRGEAECACVCVREHMCVHVHACVHVCVRACVGWCDLDCNQRSLRKRLERNNGGSKPSGLGNAEKGRGGGGSRTAQGPSCSAPWAASPTRLDKRKFVFPGAELAALRSGEGCQSPGTDRCERPVATDAASGARFLARVGGVRGAPLGCKGF